MARKHNTARGQPNKLKGDEGTPRLHGKASRGIGKEFHGRAERNIREIPRLLERIYEPRRSSYIRVCLQAWHADSYRCINPIRTKNPSLSEMMDFLRVFLLRVAWINRYI